MMMKKIIFYALIFLCFFSCQKKEPKSQPAIKSEDKDFIFLEYYENMNRNEFENTSKKLMDEGKIQYSVPNFMNSHKYIYGDCQIEMKFYFYSNKLKSITLKDAKCLIDNYSKKYSKVVFKKEKINLISSLGHNKDYNPSSKYVNNGIEILCNETDKADFNEFKTNINHNPDSYINLKKLRKNPTLIKKQKVTIEIKEKLKQGFEEFDSTIYSISYNGKLLQLINNNISREEYFSNMFSGKESPERFYTKTRSRYVASIKNKDYYKFNYDITYQSLKSYESKIKKLKDEKIKSTNKSIELKKRQEERKKESYNEI